MLQVNFKNTFGKINRISAGFEPAVKGMHKYVSAVD